MSNTATIKKLAIVGGGITKDLAPFGDQTWDIWSTASIGRGLPRVSLIWEIHRKEYIDTLRAEDMAFDCPVMMQFPNCERAVKWEPTELVKSFGKHFSGSIAYMLGEAAIRGYKKIITYGVDMLEDGYTLMREDFVYLVGLFRGMGIDVAISKGTAMLWDSTDYEFENKRPDLVYLNGKLKYTNEQLNQKREQETRIISETSYIRGCRDALSQSIQIIGG